MKFFNLLLCSCAILAASTACDENNIGNSILDSNSYLIIDSTFTITGESQKSDRIQSRTVSQLLGKLYSDEFGELESDIVTEFMPVNTIDTTGVSVNDIDSIKLNMLIPMGSYTGDSITPMRVNVYKLNKNLPYPIYSDFDPKDYYSRNDLIGSTTYTMTMLGQRDSLKMASSSGDSISFRGIEIALPKSLGQEFFQKYKTAPQVYASSDEFRKFFPGIYATTSYGDGRVINVSSTQINLFYKKHGKTSEDKDTVMSRIGQYYGVSPQVITNNNIRLVPSKKIESMIAGGDVILQSPAGYDAKIKFPAKAIYDKVKTESVDGQTVLNSITLQIPAYEIANSKKISVPSNLLLVKASEKDKFFENFSVNDNTTSFYASYNKSTKSYTFSVREYIKQFIDKNSRPEDGDEEFLIIPVDVTTERKSQYSNEYVVTSITPQISAATMVRLDTKKAKIIVTLSKKDF